MRFPALESFSLTAQCLTCEPGALSNLGVRNYLSLQKYRVRTETTASVKLGGEEKIISVQCKKVHFQGFLK